MGALQVELTDDFALMTEVRLEARRIVREGLRRVAPAAVAAVELEAERRLAEALRRILWETNYELRVLKPGDFYITSVV